MYSCYEERGTLKGCMRSALVTDNACYFNSVYFTDLYLLDARKLTF